MKKKIEIFIADDHPIYREGLQQVIERSQNFTIIGEAGDGKTALHLIEERKPDIAIIDVNMPDMSGLEVTKEIKKKEIHTKVAFLTMYKEEDLFNEAMDLGVMAYVLKDNAVTEIVKAINFIVAGRYYISPSISEYLVSRETRSKDLMQKTPGLEDLTPAERKILKLIAQGKTSKKIAAELFLSYKTVENHRSNICDKLDIHGSHSLLKFAIENKALI